MIKYLTTFLFSIALLSASAATKLKTLIHFEHNEHAVCAAGKASINALIMSIGEGEIEKIDIIGHCSPDGDMDFNLKLSEKRSMAVYEILSEAITDVGQYQLIAFGELHQPNPDQPEMNRCVELIAYVLDPNPPMLIADNPARILFPEDFPKETNTDLALKESTSEITPKSELKHLKESTTSEGTSFSVQSIYFHGNSAVYKKSAEEALEELLIYMRENDINIRIEGHVNGEFGKRYMKEIERSNPERVAYKNAEDLSLARANTIKRFLVENGIDPARIECLGKGGKFPVHKKPKNEKENAANRRIEIIVL